jgi:hypothetical protein
MLVLVSVIMEVGMRMTRSVGVRVHVFVEHDLEAPAKRVRDTAESLQTWDMVAAF